MANILKIFLKGWLIKKFGAKAGAGCLVVVILLLLVAMLIGYWIAQQ